MENYWRSASHHCHWSRFPVNISSIFISSKTENAVIDQSEVLVDELTNSISTFIDGYEKSILKMTTDQGVLDYYYDSTTF